MSPGSVRPDGGTHTPRADGALIEGAPDWSAD